MKCLGGYVFSRSVVLLAWVQYFTALGVLRYIFVERDVAVDPIAHLHLPPVSMTALYRQYRRIFDATTKKACHLADGVKAKVGATA